MKIDIKPRPRGEDGYKSFTIQIPVELEEELSKIAYQTMRSRNEVIMILLQQAVREVVLSDE